MSGIPKTRRTPTTLPKRKSIRSWRSVNSPGGPFGWQVASPVKNLEEIPADFSIKSEDLRIKTEAWVFGHLVIFMRELTSPTNKNNVICPSNTGNFPFQDRDERRSGNRMCSKFSQNCPCSIKNTSFFFRKNAKFPSKNCPCSTWAMLAQETQPRMDSARPWSGLRLVDRWWIFWRKEGEMCGKNVCFNYGKWNKNIKTLLTRKSGIIMTHLCIFMIYSPKIRIGPRLGCSECHST